MHRILVFDICSVCLLFVLFASLIARKMTKGRSNLLFLTLLIFVYISAFSDIVRVFIQEHIDYSIVSLFWINFFTYLYYFARVLTPSVYLLYIYSAIGLWHNFRYKFLVKFIWILFVSLLCIVLFSDLFIRNLFYFDKYLVYFRGKGLSVLYILSGMNILFSVICIIKNRKMIPRFKFFILFFVYLISVIGIFIQFFMPQFMVEVFTTSFPLLLISIFIQRQENILSVETGALSYSNCVEVITKNILVKRNMYVIFIKITNQKKLKNQFGIDEFHVLLKRLSEKIYAVGGKSNFELYYLEVGAFAAISYKNDEQYVKKIAECICEILSEKQDLNNLEVNLESKICVVNCPKDIDEISTMINFANSFHHLISKVNQVTYLFQEASSQEFEIRSNIDEIIKKAIMNNSFEVFYQPVYDVEKKKFTTAEALVRLRNDKYGIISPSIFIPAAERSGDIHIIGEKVFDEVCRFISKCDLNELGIENISVNLSVAQCIETDLSTKLLMIMGQHGVDVKKIILEITETSQDFNPEIYNRNIKNLSMNGIKFYVDDYGSCYSNVKHLLSLPCDVVKLDKTYVYDHSDNEMNVIICHTLNILKNLNKKVVIKGVEDAEALNYFVDAGCNFIQGYFYTKPLSQKEFIEFLRKGNA